MALAALTLLASLPGPDVARADSFTLSPAELPTGRAYASAVWTGADVLVFGGEGSGGATASIAKYNPTTDTASAASYALPSARFGTSAVWTGTHAFVFGGFGGTTGSTAGIVRVTPGTGAVTTVANLPSARYDTSAVWTGQYAFVFGGWGGVDLSDVVRYNPANGEVRVMSARLPFARAATSAIWDGTHAYVFGGTYLSGNGYVSTDEIVRYDPALDRADVVARLPSGRFLMGAAWSGEHAYLFGGVNHATGAWAKTVRFDPDTLQVVTVEGSLPTKREGAAAAWVGGSAVVAGGTYFQSGWQHLKEIVRHRENAPGAPATFTVTAGPAAGQLSLAWTPPALSGSFPVTGYRVYGGANAASLTLLASLGNVTSFSESALGDNATRHYRLAAVNLAGEGTPSATKSGTTFARPGVPRAVAPASGPGVGQIRVTWQAPAFAGSSPISEYRVYRGASPGTETLHAVTAAGTLAITDSGLSPGETLSYRVSAVNAIGEGPASASAIGRAPDVPGPPRDVAAEPGPAIASIEVTWDAPADNGGLAITRYFIERAEMDGEFAPLADVPASVTELVDEDLFPLVSYRYRVLARNAVGTGAPSAEACSTSAPWQLVPTLGVVPACP